VKKKIIFWGGTGQAIVNKEIIDLLNFELVAIFDDTINLKSSFNDIRLYNGWEGFKNWKVGKDLSQYFFSIAIGNPHGDIRVNISEKLKSYGLLPISLIHPSAIINKDTIIGEGVQIMAGVVIQARVVLGNQCIINTNASIDHEVVIGAGCEIGPGATLCGNIQLDNNVWICAGATILPRLKIGENSIVGAGSLLTKSVTSNQIFYGVPAKFKKQINK
jgi:sugar O-acyltransferase (sialic acid O-acetyltransferase NeuD family)